MIKFSYADGTEICDYADGNITKRQSKFIENYKNNALNAERAKSWKHSGEGAMFRGDVRPGEEREVFRASVNGVYPLNDCETVYSFSINGTSGIYKTDTGNEKSPEVHIISSVDGEFSGGCLDADKGILVCSVARNDINADIAVFDTATGDYKTVTDGDTFDYDPFISPDNANIIYFASRGAGRDANGNFVKYSNASICKMDLSALTVEEAVSSEKLNYIKPVFFDGKLYAITTPGKEKKTNPVLEILLIPFRIVQAIANFINAFVTMFTGKSLASGGSNPAKGREFDSRKEYIKGNLINYETELKNNARKKDKDYGFIPSSWKLVEVESGSVIKSGVADYDILEDGTFIVTNGRRIFAVKDGKTQKLCNTEKCLVLGCRHSSRGRSDLFGF